MRKLLVVLLLMFVSLPTAAVETSYYDALLKNRNVIYDPTRIAPYEGTFTGQAAASTPMLTIPLVSKGKFSFFGAVDQGIGAWDRKTRTMRLSSELGIGSVRNGSLLGHGVGLKYRETPAKTYYVAGIRSGGVEGKRETILMFGVNINFR